MASTVTAQQVPSAITTHTADVVGIAFVHQYYHILHHSPELVHRFYHDDSKLGRPEGNGVMCITSTMQAINEKILSLGYIDEAKHETGSQDPINNTEASLTPEQDLSPAPENHIVEQLSASPEEANGQEVYNPSENGDGSIEEEEAPVAEVVDDIPDDSQMVDDSNSKIEEVPKKSYASIVKFMTENSVSSSTPTHSPVQSIVKNYEQLGTAAPPIVSAPVSDAQTSINNITENGNHQDVEAEGPSIYIKGLPLNATPDMLENEFKRFGSIKNGGIQVLNQKGFCFGFVEFEVASSAQSAIELLRSSAGNKGRSSSGSRAGYRHDGARGRGNYTGGGGRGYSRGEFGGSRSNNRGGYSNRRGNGYPRGDYMGSNGGSRMNHSGGAAVSGGAKSMAPRVSAPA
ncbi:hypothetical protein V6N13_046088 [Hibiscus sabdariffa]